MNKPLQFEESMALLDADRIANDARLSNILQSLNQYSAVNFDLLKQSTMTAHRLQLKLVRKEKVIKKLQHQLKTMATAQKKEEKMIEDETKSEEHSGEEINKVQELLQQIENLNAKVKILKEKNKDKARLIKKYKIALEDFEEQQYKEEDPDEKDGKPDVVSDAEDLDEDDDPDSNKDPAAVREDLLTNDDDAANISDPDDDDFDPETHKADNCITNDGIDKEDSEEMVDEDAVMTVDLM